MRRVYLSIVAFVVWMIVPAVSAAASVLTFDGALDANVGAGNWNTFVVPPSVFAIDNTSFAPNNVLHFGITGQSGLGGSGYRGYTHDAGGVSTAFTFDFYVDGAAWSGQNVYAGLWALGHDSLSQPTPNSMLVYQSTSTFLPGFYAYDNLNNTFVSVGAGNQGWNTLLLELTPGVGLSYSLNGVVCATTADVNTVGFDSFAVMGYANHVTQNFYFDNVGAVAGGANVPEPSSLLCASGMFLWLNIRRRQRSQT